MTLEELQKSDVVKQHLANILADKVFSAVLDAMQRESLPTGRKTPTLVPGVHYDTTLAHDDRYRAGWSDFAEALRKLPIGTGIKPEDQEEEELFAHTPEVQEIDQQLKKTK